MGTLFKPCLSFSSTGTDLIEHDVSTLCCNFPEMKKISKNNGINLKQFDQFYENTFTYAQ